MGVDFLICTHCNDTFCDCGPYIRCYNCWRKWCSDECAEADGYKKEEATEEDDEDADEPLTSCKFCRGETVDDKTLLAFLLKHNNFTKEEAIQLCLKNG